MAHKKVRLVQFNKVWRLYRWCKINNLDINTRKTKKSFTQGRENSKPMWIRRACV